MELIELLVSDEHSTDVIHQWFLDNDCEHYFSKPYPIPDHAHRKVRVFNVYGIYPGFSDVAMLFKLRFSATQLDKPYLWTQR